MSNQIATQTKSFDLSPQTFEQALTFSGFLAIVTGKQIGRAHV